MITDTPTPAPPRLRAEKRAGGGRTAPANAALSRDALRQSARRGRAGDRGPGDRQEVREAKREETREDERAHEAVLRVRHLTSPVSTLGAPVFVGERIL